MSREILSENPERSINKIPWPGLHPLGFAFFGNIYLRDSLWKDYLTGDPSPRTLSILAHERTHIKRLGNNIKLQVKYWSDPGFRLQEELAAIHEEMKVLKTHNEKFTIDERARDLSSVAYLWCTDYETAKSKLENVWKEI